MVNWKHRFWASAYSLLVCILLFMPTAELNLPTSIVMKGMDKLVHFAIFSLLSILWVKAFREMGKNPAYLESFVLTLAFGIITERIQGITDYRSFEWMDILADIAGLLFGLVIYCFLKKIPHLVN